MNTDQAEPAGAWLAKPTWGAGSVPDKLPYAGLCCCRHAAGNKLDGPDRACSGRTAQAALTPQQVPQWHCFLVTLRPTTLIHHVSSPFIMAVREENVLALFTHTLLTYSSGKVLSLILAISCQDN